MRLAEYSYKSISFIQGPLLFVEDVANARMGEIVKVVASNGREVEGQVLKIESSTVLVQILGESSGLDIENTSVVFTDMLKQAPLSQDMINRTFNGAFEAIDGNPMFIPEKYSPIGGLPINPTARGCPEEFIETGYSAIDGLNSLVKGQKLPVFSCAGLPSTELAASILKNSRVISGPGGHAGTDFIIIFVALGLTHHEYAFYMKALESMQTGQISFINLASDPAMERLLAPRFGLTAAEYLAFELGMDVLVVITDMTNYCDALREISTARKELPGRRGYPGYMYSDLASLFERAGRLIDRTGSVTMLPLLTMPDDDITHPIPDLTGYITEGQIVLSREMYQKGIAPPIDVLPCLSRLMGKGIGKGHTRSDHRQVADQLYKHYARGRDLRNLEAIVGREGINKEDLLFLDFADAFELKFINQAGMRRSVEETLDLGIKLLSEYSEEQNSSE